MAMFFVGQRVRIKWAHAHATRAIGSECRIVADRVVFGIEIWQLDLIDPQDGRAWQCEKRCADEMLEPILPDGHRACDEDFKRDLDRLLERQGIAA